LPEVPLEADSTEDDSSGRDLDRDRDEVSPSANVTLRRLPLVPSDDDDDDDDDDDNDPFECIFPLRSRALLSFSVRFERYDRDGG